MKFWRLDGFKTLYVLLVFYDSQKLTHKIPLALHFLKTIGLRISYIRSHPSGAKVVCWKKCIVKLLKCVGSDLLCMVLCRIPPAWFVSDLIRMVCVGSHPHGLCRISSAWFVSDLIRMGCVGSHPHGLCRIPPAWFVSDPTVIQHKLKIALYLENS